MVRARGVGREIYPSDPSGPRPEAQGPHFKNAHSRQTPPRQAAGLFAVRWLRLAGRSVCERKEGGVRDLQPARQLVYALQGDVSQTAFNSRDIGPVQIRPLCQCFLGNAETVTQASDGGSKARCDL